MLKQEHISEAAPRAYMPVGPLSAMPPEAEAVTPQELAQAIVAVEDRYKSSLQTDAGAAVIQQAIAHSGAAVTPNQLLAEVHRQRGRSHENTAMTPHLTQNLSVRLLIAWGIFASLAAVFLFATSFVFATRLSAASEDQAKFNMHAAQKASAPSALQTLQAWNYPGAASLGSGQGGKLASATLTTSDDYTKVWEFYSQQTGFTKIRQQQNLHGAKIDPTQNLSAGGNTIINGQTVDFNIQSDSTKTDQSATFTQGSPQHTVMTTLTHHVGTPITTIRIITTTP